MQYTFPLTLAGDGDTRDQAWADAVEAFQSDPGSPPDANSAIQPDPVADDDEHDAFVLVGGRAYVRLLPSISGALREVKLLDDESGLLTVEYFEGDRSTPIAAFEVSHVNGVLKFKHKDNLYGATNYDRPEPES